MIGALIVIVSAVRLTYHTAGSENYQNIKLKGPKNAPIQVVIYSDFECPACRVAVQPMEELRAEFADVMQVEFRHFPLERAHRWALMAATFAECAAEQNKFWELHDRLYAEQPIWSKSEDAIPSFASYAQELNLNREALERCIEIPKTLVKIHRERAMGEKQKVQSTPSIFINGRPLIGALQLKIHGKEIVLDELQKAGLNSDGSKK